MEKPKKFDLFTIKVWLDENEDVIINLKCHAKTSDGRHYKKTYRAKKGPNNTINPVVWPLFKETIKEMLDSAYQFEEAETVIDEIKNPS